MNVVIANIYKKLADIGRIEESSIPEEAKEILSEEKAETMNTTIEEVVELPGPINIPDIETDNIEFSNGKYIANINLKNVFTNELLDGKPYPEISEVYIKRVEHNVKRFPMGMDSWKLIGDKEEFSIELIPNYIVDNDSSKLFRVDIVIDATNYDGEMYLSIYYNK